jgi:putative ATPase
MKEIGYGHNYQYAHDYENNFVNQEFLPEQVKNTLFYQPGDNPRENEMRKFLRSRWGEKYGY